MKIILDKLTTKVHRYKDDNIVIKNNFLYSVINGLPFLHTKEKNLNYTLKFINNIKTGLNKYDGRTRLAHYLYNLSIDEYNKFKDLKDYDSSYLPGCGLSIVHFEDDYAELYTLGDCYIVYETKDDKKYMLHSQDICDLNASAVDNALSISKKKKFSMKKSLNRINDVLIENRKLLNSNNQFGMFTLSSKPQFRFNHRKVKLSELKYIYLFSDGFASAFQNLKMFDSFEEMFNKDLDIHSIESKIIKLWESDKRLKKFPRLSYKEDISVIKLVFDK